MIFTLEALQALYGDSLILHYGTAKQPRWMILDGGPPTVYANALQPRLEELRGRFSPTSPLPIQALIVSHLDEDHIKGVEDLLEDLEDKKSSGDSLTCTIATLWHNAFNDLLGDDKDELAKLISSGAIGASAASLAAVLPLGDDHLVRERAAVAASVGQGRNVRDLAGKLKIAVNRIPTDDGKAAQVRLIMAPATGRNTISFPDGPQITVVGPLEQQVRTLHKEWSKQVAAAKKKKGKAKAQAIAAAYLDKSVFNLSSIVLLVEFKGKRMLLTGDARGDYVLNGLEAAGLLDQGKIHVDILKLPHHGSNRNVEKEFFEQITADHYVVSANGKYDNPDIDTLRWIADARGSKAKFKIHVTNRTGEKNLGKRIDALLAEKEYSFLKKLLVAREPTALGLKVDLLDSVEF